MRLLSRVDGKLHISADVDTAPNKRKLDISGGTDTAPNESPIRYGILSHRWLGKGEDVTFEDVTSGHANKSEFEKKAGIHKLNFCLEKAAEHNLSNVWIDSCCIDRRDKHELGKSINKMFRYYAESTICFVYLADVEDSAIEHGLHASQWFRRGWTLQELIAPSDVRFFSKSGTFIGDKVSLCQTLMSITNIDVRNSWRDASIPTRYQWSINRETKEEEDMSYCLLGILEVSISPNYGEGSVSAQERLLDAVEKEHGRKAMREIHQISRAIRQTQYKSLLLYVNMNSRRATIADPFPDTCEWLLTHEHYKAWSRMNLPFLWIKGKPGSGKSTLVKFADTSSQARCVKISFYFNARGDHLEKCVEGMYRSLLFQIIAQRPDAIRHAIDNFLIEQEQYSGAVRMTVSTLQEAFTVAVMNLKESTQCFIDALDECNQSEVQAMINYFENLSRKTSLHVCFASRYYPSITIKSPEISLEHQSEQDLDLRNYVYGNSQVESHHKDEIVRKANGVFLWVVLVVRLLNEEYSAGRNFNFQARLDEIPGELNELLGKIANRPENRIEFRIAIQWILFAGRPLSPREYYSAILVGLNKAGQIPDSSYKDSRNVGSVATKQIKKFVDSSSRGLAELTKGSTPTVQFIHESVRDFWLQHGGLRRLFSQRRYGLTSYIHDELRELCYRYFNTDVIYKTVVEKLEDTTEAFANDVRTVGWLNLQFPLLEYVTTHLFYHADEASDEIPQHRFMDEFTRQSASLLGRCCRVSHDQETTVEWGGLASRYGYVDQCSRDESIALILTLGDYDRMIDVAGRHGFNFRNMDDGLLTVVNQEAKPASLRALRRHGMKAPDRPAKASHQEGQGGNGIAGGFERNYQAEALEAFELRELRAKRAAEEKRLAQLNAPLEAERQRNYLLFRSDPRFSDIPNPTDRFDVEINHRER